MKRNRAIAFLFLVLGACGPDDGPDPPDTAGDEQSASAILGETDLGDGKSDVTDFATELEMEVAVESSIDLTATDEVQSRSELVKVFTIEADADAQYAVAMLGQGELDPRLIVSYERAPVTESLDFELFPFGRETDSLVIFRAAEAGTYAILALDTTREHTGAFRIEASRVEGEVPLDLATTSTFRRVYREALAEYEPELTERLTAGQVAEPGDGYLHPGEELNGVPLEERAEINRFVAAVNADREEAFQTLADEELGTSDEEEIGQIGGFLSTLWAIFR